MIIYPDLELRKGRLVNLLRNRIDSPLIYDIEPLQAARELAAQGAEWLHVVDLDAVFNEGENTAIIKEIIRKVSCPVQVGGAIRSMDKVHSWMEAGAGRVVIATAAVKYPHFVKAAATAYPDSVVVSIDARGGHVAIEGWTEETTFTPIEFAHRLGQEFDWLDDDAKRLAMLVARMAYSPDKLPKDARQTLETFWERLTTG